MQTVKYTVPNISCGHCTNSIKMEVIEMEGVSSVEAEIASKEVVISYDAPATEEKIISLMKEINYAPVIA